MSDGKEDPAWMAAKAAGNKAYQSGAFDSAGACPPLCLLLLGEGAAAPRRRSTPLPCVRPPVALHSSVCLCVCVSLWVTLVWCGAATGCNVQCRRGPRPAECTVGKEGGERVCVFGWWPLGGHVPCVGMMMRGVPLHVTCLLLPIVCVDV